MTFDFGDKIHTNDIDLEQVMIRRFEGETMASIARSMGVSETVIYARLKEQRQKTI